MTTRPRNKTSGVKPEWGQTYTLQRLSVKCRFDPVLFCLIKGARFIDNLCLLMRFFSEGSMTEV